MRKLLLILTAFLPGLCFSQNIDVKYSVYSKARAKVIKQIKENKENEGYQGVLSSLSAEKKDSFELIIQDKKSSFKRIEPDIELSADKGPEIVLVGPGYSEEGVSIYKDLAGKRVTELRRLLGHTYSITHPLRPYAWQVTSEQKEIMGLQAYKATIGDSITAWFCPAIPVQEGPALYNGLPGLILDLEDPQTIYTCMAINTQSERKMDKPRKAKSVTEKKFEQLRQRALNRKKE